RRPGEPRAVPRRPHLRHQRRAHAPSGGGRADLPRVAHPHARHQARRPVAGVRLRFGDVRCPVERGARGLLRRRPRREPRHGGLPPLRAADDHAPGTQTTATTNQSHDLTGYPEVGLAAGACSGNGILLDISDPVAPKRLDHVADENFAYWHSATFDNSGTKVIFTDEWGGGLRPRCQATDKPTWGANAIFEIVDRKLKFAGY